MSSPNEPGNPRTGERPGGATGSAADSTPDGSSPGSPVTRPATPAPAGGQVVDSGEVPPWQRGAAARDAQPSQRPAKDPPNRPEGSRGGASPAHSPTTGTDARLNRFIAGGPTTPPAAPPPSTESAPPPSRAERTEVTRPPEAYTSELPDLSGSAPRSPQRKPAERPAAESRTASSSGSRVQVAPRAKGPVRASMQIRHIDPWSTLKVSLVLSVAMFFVWMIAVAFLYLVLGGMGVWSKLNSNVGDLLTSASGSTGGDLVSSGTIFGGATLIGLVNIVLMTAAATIAVFIYNLTTDLVGGIEVTLADRE